MIQTKIVVAIERSEIVHSLEDAHQRLFKWLDDLPDAYWEEGPPGKWTVGQQIRHLLQSLSQLNKALGIPKVFLGWRFGIANRPVRSYDEVVARYKARLTANPGVVAPAARGMPVPTQDERPDMVKRLRREEKRLSRTALKWSDRDLDRYILPHPLMGKMPIRELIMWTAFHTEHHLRQLENNYGPNTKKSN